ncbi:hypothetical protein K2173_015001 [Erythroxylum novogranatense]|uniref:Uncharacterized protein n=1 Tax=Erythroxylum novogranatense TaxID=1862640 RepID=A0AAV8TU22_9ROSI|nr:hypothetical protein K2173_015001 [Erythroxylum novogranatense]
MRVRTLSVFLMSGCHREKLPFGGIDSWVVLRAVGQFFLLLDPLLLSGSWVLEFCEEEEEEEVVSNGGGSWLESEALEGISSGMAFSAIKFTTYISCPAMYMLRRKAGSLCFCLWSLCFAVSFVISQDTQNQHHLLFRYDRSGSFWNWVVFVFASDELLSAFSDCSRLLLLILHSILCSLLKLETEVPFSD